MSEGGWGDAVLTEKAAISNGPFSLLSLTAARRLNSDAGEKALDDSGTEAQPFQSAVTVEGWGGGAISHLVLCCLFDRTPPTCLQNLGPFYRHLQQCGPGFSSQDALNCRS